MASAITMPRLSDSMEEGTVVRWLVAVGESVEKGQALVEIDTDKATMEYEAEVAGTLLSTLVEEGQDAAIGDVIGWVGEPGEDVPATDSGPAVAAPTARGEATRATDPAPTTERAGDRVNASPVARRLARELGVDLATVAGTGRGGMISREDVEAAAGSGAAAPEVTARGEAQLVELSRLQQTVARRMVEGSAAPDFAVEMDVDMTQAVELRRGLGEGSAPAPTLNDLVVKAVALALRDFPRVNGCYTERGLELYSRVNVGVAVATDDGLVVPTVFDADRKSLAEIGGETRTLAEKVRDRSIAPAELEGGTFTVSNLGMLGVRRFFPILNPPQAAILGVGEVARRAVVDDEGEITKPSVMSLCLVCDHRIVYGAEAARFLARVRELLEQPGALVS